MGRYITKRYKAIHFFLLKSWYGKTGKDFNCKTLYNMCMEKKVLVVIKNNPDKKIDKWWITLYSSDLDRKIQELLLKFYHSAFPLGDKTKRVVRRDRSVRFLHYV
jgi:hypothetical protein